MVSGGSLMGHGSCTTQTSLPDFFACKAQCHTALLVNLYQGLSLCFDDPHVHVHVKKKMYFQDFGKKFLQPHAAFTRLSVHSLHYVTRLLGDGNISRPAAYDPRVPMSLWRLALMVAIYLQTDAK